MPGPFNPAIYPVRVTIHFNDLDSTWHVTMSRQVSVGSGVKREISRQTFTDYGAALTAISIFWGNS